ncbi:type II toxin-antitoxin system VapC family toxin [Brevundimonas sp.]|uniref:type II toxin-antitoxin system VapC family toxin n=1 Tax=Brevundimonas sp. TaxID=1871086 RepID=UPI00391D0983
MIVLDASVAIKTILSEDGSERALEVLRQKHCIAPDLIIPECANIVWKHHKRGELTQAQVHEARLLLDAMQLYIEPSRRLLHRALPLASELGHPAYDCFYLALAEQEHSILLTADRKLRDAVASAPDGVVQAEVILLADFDGIDAS